MYGFKYLFKKFILFLNFIKLLLKKFLDYKIRFSSLFPISLWLPINPLKVSNIIWSHESEKRIRWCMKAFDDVIKWFTFSHMSSKLTFTYWHGCWKTLEGKFSLKCHEMKFYKHRKLTKRGKEEWKLFLNLLRDSISLDFSTLKTKEWGENLFTRKKGQDKNSFQLIEFDVRSVCLFKLLLPILAACQIKKWILSTRGFHRTLSSSCAPRDV